MKYALEYKGYYLDIIMRDGVIYGDIKGLNISITSITIKGIVTHFREEINRIH